MIIDATHTSSLAYLTVPLVLGFWGALIPAISGLAGLFSKGSKGSQDARLQQDAVNANIYRDQVAGQLGLGQLDLAQQQFGLQAPGKRMADVARSGLLQNVGDFSMGGPGSWKATGGLRPSVMQGDPATMEAARLLQAAQLKKLASGEQFKAIEFPEMPQQSKAGWLEKIMGGIGLGGSILGGLGEAGVLGGRPSPLIGRGFDQLMQTPTVKPYDPFE